MKSIRAHLNTLEHAAFDALMQHRNEHLCRGVNCADEATLGMLWGEIAQQLVRLKKADEKVKREAQQTAERVHARGFRVVAS